MSTRDIKEFCSEIGFQLAGVSAADHLPDVEAVMLARVNDGKMGGLAWFTEDRARKCCDPSLVVPSARSVLCLAASYLVEAEGYRYQRDPGEPRGRISRYAWSRDYHDVMRKQMERVVEFLGQKVRRPVEARMFIDSAPIAERAFASRCGIGWFGKSTNILTRDHGSWVFLGEIVTDLEFEIDPPLSKTCGQCDLCLRSCPTQAIVSPYTVDAGRCISYLTIELKGAIPRELRPLIGDWIFGCDVCQEACPVNGRVKAREPNLFSAIDGFDPNPSLIALLGMSDEEYYARFRFSPVWRAKKRGLQRNAAVALGNCGDPSVVPHLVRFLDSPEELVRGHVAWALGRLGGRLAKSALELHRGRETSEFVMDELDNALPSLVSC